MIARFSILAVALAALSSCATYKTGQTPDDVYYSPSREVDAYVETDRDEDDRFSYNDRNLEDRRLRQQIRDPRFRTIEDDIFWNNPRIGFNSFGMNSWNSWNNWSAWNNPWGWNSWNNPWGWNGGWGHGMGFNNGWNNGWNGGWGWNPGFICIPTSTSTIVIGGPARTNATGIRYSSPVQTFRNTGVVNGKGTYSNGGGRYFNGGANNGGRSSSFFGGGSSNNSYNRSSGNGRSFFSNGSSNSNGGSMWRSSNSTPSSSFGGGRTFSSGGGSGSSGRSSGSSSGGGATRRN